MCAVRARSYSLNVYCVLVLSNMDLCPMERRQATYRVSRDANIALSSKKESELQAEFDSYSFCTSQCCGVGCCRVGCNIFIFKIQSPMNFSQSNFRYRKNNRFIREHRVRSFFLLRILSFLPLFFHCIENSVLSICYTYGLLCVE